MNNNHNQKSKDPKTKDQLKTYAKVSGAGFQMLATIAAGAFIGYKLDEKFPNKHNLYTVIFILVFIGIALFSVIRQVTKITNQSTKNEQNNK